MFRYIYDILFFTFTKRTESTLIPIDEEWVAILSECEEKVIESQRNQLNVDIQGLKERSTKLTYKDLIKEIKLIMYKHQEQIDTIKDIPMMSSLKLGVFKDVFNDLSSMWLSTLERFTSILLDQWYPTEYERNILGELIAIANQFTPDKLSPRGLSQMVMSVHLSLINSIDCIRGKSLNNEESKIILEMIVDTAVEPIIELWIKTINKSKGSANRIGKLPSKWKGEEVIRQEKYELLKQENKVNAKFLSTEEDPVRRKYLIERFGVDIIGTNIIEFQNNNLEVALSQPNINFKLTQKFLENNLNLMNMNMNNNMNNKNKDKIEGNNLKFQKAKIMLQNKLILRLNI